MGRPRLGPRKADRVYTVRLTEAEARLFDAVRAERSPSDALRHWLREALCQGSELDGEAPRHRPRAQLRELVCLRCFRKFAVPKGAAVPLHTREGLVLVTSKSRSAKQDQR